MNTLFPASPINPRAIDDAFAVEATAAKDAGFGISRVNLEAILGGEIRLAGIPEERGDFTGRGDILYRGWLMKPEQYLALDLKLGRRLVTGPASYETAYNLPFWLELFEEGITPRTLVIPGHEFDLDAVADQVYRALGHSFTNAQLREIDEIHEWQRVNNTMVIQHRPDLLCLPRPYPVMVKDFLKSAKHQWHDACYIPRCDDKEDVKRVTGNFLRVQGEHLTGGLCFRQFIPGKPIGIHSKTKQPLVNEWRAFLRFGKAFYLCPYWSEGDYSKGDRPTMTLVNHLCQGLKELPFVAVDFGERDVPDVYGHWVVYEVNDGGAAGVPDGGDINEFYRALFKEFSQ